MFDKLLKLCSGSSTTPEADPLGLTVLYTPQSPRSADVIFVHGLGGTSVATWSQHRDLGRCWPKLWLPTERHVSTARILSFGYNARFLASGPKDISGITDFAKSLLFEMKYSKDEPGEDLGIGNVPVVFVVHSMGGLVFKKVSLPAFLQSIIQNPGNLPLGLQNLPKAYLHGLIDEEYKSIVTQIRAVLFLSTPHRGTDLAGILNGILSISVLRYSPKKYISELNRNSPALEELNETFRNIAPNLEIFSFYETLETSVGPRSIMILGKESSILGYPGEVSLPLTANHHNVCKFSDMQNSNYKRVRSVLQTLISKIVEERTSERRSATLRDISKIGLLLSVVNAPTAELTNLHKLRAAGTCEDLLTSRELKNWLSEDSRSSIIWMHARPGSGKSIKASFLIDHLKGAGHLCQYYFFKYQDSTKRSLNSLLRSLAYQLAQDLRSFREILERMADGTSSYEKMDGRLLWHTLFESVLFKTSLQKPIYWVIDALDESDSATTVIECLSGIQSSGIPIHVTILSRNIPPISMAFDRAATSTAVTVLCVEDNVKDIRTYAEKEMVYMHGALEFRKRIINQVVERAEGSFLWAHLALHEIRQSHSEEDCRKALEEIPSGMEPLYQRMENSIARLSRPSDLTSARLLLIWATYSRRPLSVEDLLQALQPEHPAILDLPYTISQVCGQFVVADSNGQVSLIHQTAREYLTNASNLPFPLTSQGAHQELFTRTISVFIDAKVQAKLSHKTLPPFYLYAATSWAFHLSYIPPDLDDPLSLLAKFFGGSYVLSWIEALGLGNQLQVLISTSCSLTSYIRRRRKLDTMNLPLQRRIIELETLELWATDLLKLVGKFGSRLLQDSTAIYKFIPQLSPPNSALHRQFRSSPLSIITVTGLSATDWDDLISRVSIGAAGQASMVTCSARFVAVVTSVGTIILFNVLTFDQVYTFSHLEDCFRICFNRCGARLATYGFRTTKVWDVTSGQLFISIPNPSYARAMDMCFAENDTVLLMLTNFRGAWRLNLQNAVEGWQTLHTFKTESDIEGAVTNSPTSFSFNNNATQVAIGYRGSPVEVWDLTPPKLVNRCRRVQQRSNQARRTWTGTVRTRWHSHSGEVLGVYTDGVVFKWDPLTESHTELPKNFNSAPSEIQCSPDGLIFATSNVGVVKLYNYEDFTLIYQLSSENAVTSLCFSLDSRRFYDIRGSYCNIWEPNALIRLSDANQRTGEAESEAGSLTDASQYASEAWVDTSSPLTALAAGPKSRLLCAGNEDGTTFVQDTWHDAKVDIASSPVDMSIEHVAWSSRGEYLAYLDLCRKLVVKAVDVQVETQLEARWLQRTVLDGKVKLSMRSAQQLFFNPDSTLCLVANRQQVQVWSLQTRSVCATYQSTESGTDNIWVTHPADSGKLLAFSGAKVAEHSWADFAKTFEWRIGTTRNAGPVPIAEDESGNRLGLPRERSGSGLDPEETINQVEVSFSREYFLLSFAPPGSTHSSAVRFSKLFIIPVSSLSRQSASIGTVITLPQDISEAIERPLNMLGRDRLVFIDKSFWLCTWRVDFGHGSNAAGSGASGIPDDHDVRKLSAATTLVERRRSTVPNRLVRHFFLPQDWINAEVLRLCQVTADGTFLCPRKGEVAVIKSDLGSNW